MADDTVFTIKFTLDPGSTVEDAKKTAADAAKAFQEAFQPKLTPNTAAGGTRPASPTNPLIPSPAVDKETQTSLTERLGTSIGNSLAPILTKAINEGLKGRETEQTRARTEARETIRRSGGESKEDVEHDGLVARGLSAVVQASGLLTAVTKGASAMEAISLAIPLFETLRGASGREIALSGRGGGRAATLAQVTGTAIARESNEGTGGGAGASFATAVTAARAARNLAATEAPLAAAEGGATGETGLLSRLSRTFGFKGADGLASATAGGEAGGTLGGVIGGLKNGIVGALSALAVREAVKGIDEAAMAVKELGVHSAETNIQMHAMAETLGVPLEKLFVLRSQFTKTGVDLDDFSNAFTRSAVAIKRDTPEINRRIADSANVMTEARIKIKESGRDVEESYLAQKDASDALSQAQVRLAQSEQTGPTARGLQLSQLQLGVQGAKIGQQTAGFGLRSAYIQAQFSPAEASLQAASSLDGIRGAKLGLEAAEIQRDKAYGINTQYRSLLLSQDVGDEGVRQARLRLRRARLSEEERSAQEAAGVGPVGQAYLQLRSAAQAQRTADLQEKAAALALENEQIRQAGVTYEQEHAAAGREVTRARINVARVDDQAQTAKIEQQRAGVDLERTRLSSEPEVAREVEARKGGTTTDLDLRQIPGDTLRQYLIRQSEAGGGGLGASLEAVADYIKIAAPNKEDRAEQTRALVAVLGPLRNLADLDKILDYLRLPKEERTATPEMVAQGKEMARRLTGGLPGSEEVIAAQSERTETSARARLLNGLLAEQTTLSITALGKAADASSAALQEAGLKGADAINSAAKGLAQAITDTAAAVKNAGSEGANQRLNVSTEAAGGPGDATSPTRNPRVRPPTSAYAPEVVPVPSTPTPAENNFSNSPLPTGLELPLTPTPPPAGPTTITSPAVTIQTGSTTINGGQSQQPLQATEVHATGGLIHGPGSETSDSIPIMASQGEYIIKASRTRELGTPFLDALNNRTMRPSMRLKDLAGGTSNTEAEVHALGGLIPSATSPFMQPSSQGSYDIPARVSAGEYRVSAETVGHYGRALFDALNQGASPATVKHLAKGGPVGGAQGLLQQFAYNTAASVAKGANLQSIYAPAGLGEAAAEEAGQYLGRVPPYRGPRTPTPDLRSLGVDLSQFKTPALTNEQTQLYAGLAARASDLSTLGVLPPRDLLPTLGESTVAGGSSLSTSHQLDLRTTAGTFSVAANDATLEAIRMSAIGSKLSSTGQRPSWWS